MLYKLLLGLLMSLHLGASEPVDLAFFQDKPRSLAKDFYIFEYLKRDETTPAEAKALFGEVHTMNMRFFHLFAKKMDNAEYKKVSKCVDLDVMSLLKEDDECLNIGISLSKISSLSKSQLPLIQPRIHSQELVNLITLMESETMYESTLQSGTNTFLTLFNGSISAYRIANFNAEPLTKAYLDTLSLNPKFNRFVFNIVQNDKLDVLQKSLVSFTPSLHVKSKTLFYLGLNALKYNNKEQANTFFALAQKNATQQEERDKALFWQYEATQDPSYLDQLAHSNAIDIYSLFAREKLTMPFPNVLSPTLEGKHPTFNISDPFGWPRILNHVYSMNIQEVEALANSFKYANTLPHYVYLMERVSHYAYNYYPIPYHEEISHYSIPRQALMLAIARQESRFIPSVVSTSYALGMMQFMPFVARDIAKKEKLENFDIGSMFDPRVAFLFGNLHLDFLEKSLYHPLFVAYAYNGGIGFTKRHLLSGAFSEGTYEPFWSMETMSNEESREYGKKVLANYVVYSHLLGEDVSINNLFQMLLIPSQSDRFRN